jgi:deazaflavin-dependent oxidoreductase (nitroreductase family)
MARTESRPRSRPNAALRVAFRLPVYPYRYRLGWLFGHRLLLLVHRGRKSGYVYQTVLEVVRHDPARRESIVVSAWGGEKADWYRNLRAAPAVEIRIRRERYVPHATVPHPRGGLCRDR